MKKIALLLLLLPLATFSCLKKDEKPKKAQVLITAPPYAYFVKKLAEDYVDIITLIPEGANPHLFEPTPQQVDLIYRSQLWIRSAEAFEEKISKAITNNKKPLPMLDLTEGFIEKKECTEKHHHHHCHTEAEDLHLWMSPTIAKQQVFLIARHLSQILPEHRTLIEERAKSLEIELDTLRVAIHNRLAPFQGQSIIVSHPAFGRYCKDFGLNQISIEMEGKEPLPKDILTIVEKASHSTARVVLSQIQHNNHGAIAIAKELSLPCISTDPYSSNYKEMLLHITEAIATCHD